MSITATDVLCVSWDTRLRPEGLWRHTRSFSKLFKNKHSYGLSWDRLFGTSQFCRWRSGRYTEGYCRIFKQIWKLAGQCSLTSEKLGKANKEIPEPANPTRRRYVRLHTVFSSSGERVEAFDITVIGWLGYLRSNAHYIRLLFLGFSSPSNSTNWHFKFPHSNLGY